MLTWFKNLFRKPSLDPVRHIPLVLRKTVECSCGAFMLRKFMEDDATWSVRVSEFLTEHTGEIIKGHK